MLAVLLAVLQKNKWI